jgi:hypothetical protein
MVKKIFDILPPKELKEEEEVEIPAPKPFWSKLKKPKKPKIKVPPLLKSRKNLVLVSLILVLALFSCCLTLSKAEIEIWPEAEILTFETELTIDKTTESIDFQDKVIPGKVFEVEKTVTEKFSSSGKTFQEKKAEGVIRVYNNYSTVSQAFRVNTRFMSDSGKVFRTPERIVVPGKKEEEGKWVPGYLDVKVVAAETGADYNIGPSTFSIPGLQGTELYTAFYGKSLEPMKGGFKEEVFQVTQKDLDQAEDTLTKKAKEECEASLKEKITSEFDLLKEASETKILETFSLAQAGEEKERFTFQVKAKSRVLVFEPENVESFAADFISSQLSSGKKLYLESLKINHSLESRDFELGKMVLSLEIEAKIYSDIDEISLKKGLLGKSLTETEIFLENQPQITKAQVKLWPFWVKKVPESIDKIKIELNL